MNTLRSAPARSAVVTKLGRDAFAVSDRGLRHRLLVERFGSKG